MSSADRRPCRALRLTIAVAGLWLASALQIATAAPEEWTVAVQLKDKLLSDDLPVLVDGGTLYLPLVQFSALLLVPVEKNRTGNYSGTVSSTGRIFSISPSTLRVWTDGASAPLAPTDIVDVHGDLYVVSTLIEKIVPLHVEFDTRSGMVKLSAEQPLPVEVRWRQEILRLHIPGPTPQLRTTTLDVPYAAVSAPTADVNLFAAPLAATGTRLSYNALVGGDVAYLTGQLFVTGDDQQWLRDARISLGREHPGGGVFGLAPVTAAWAGDVAQPTLALVGGGELGRGILVSTMPLDRPDSFDTTTVEGDSTPGWIVELYQNNLLIASQTADASGRYQFKNVPLFYGTNALRLLHYGPQGQVREETRTVTVGGNMTPSGATLMRAYVGQPGERVLSALLPAAPSDSGAGFSFEIDHGFSKFLSATAFVSRAPVSLLLGSDLVLSSGVGVQADLGSLALQSDVAMQEGGGYSFDIGAITAIDDISLSARYARFEDFQSVAASDGLEPLTSLATMRAMTSFAATPIGPLALGFLGEYRTYVDGHQQATAGFDIRHSIGPLYIDHEFDLQRNFYGNGVPSSTSALYTGALSAFFNPVSIQAAAQVNFMSRDPFENVAVSAVVRLDDRSTAGVAVNHSPVSGGSSLNANYSRELDFATVFGQASIDDKGAYTLGFGLSFSVGVDRRGDPFMTSQGLAHSGTLAPFVYYDADANGRFDPATDRALPGVGFRSETGRHARTDDNGDALLTGRSIDEPSAIEIDPSTLADPFWIPESGPVAIDARPGEITLVDMAVVEGGEISGQVSAKSDAGPVGGLSLRLVGRDKRVIATLTSLSDGSYYFEAIPPGTVTVEIVAGQTMADVKIAVQSRLLTVKPGGIVTDGTDFIVDVGVRAPAERDLKKRATPVPAGLNSVPGKADPP